MWRKYSRAICVSFALLTMQNACVSAGKSGPSCFTATPMDILSMDALSVSEAIKEKRISSQEVMQATLDRISEVNPKYNAIIQLRDRDELMKLARQADESDRKGWLHGIPIAIKDICNVKGIPTSMGGSPLYEDCVPDSHDLFVENIVEAGAIVIGKTNTPENGLGSHTFNNRWGTTTNPFDASKSAGGSSGGAAVAVATRMLYLADGTDMQGSLRNPGKHTMIATIHSREYTLLSMSHLFVGVAINSGVE